MRSDAEAHTHTESLALAASERFSTSTNELRRDVNDELHRELGAAAGGEVVVAPLPFLPPQPP